MKFASWKSEAWKFEAGSGVLEVADNTTRTAAQTLQFSPKALRESTDSGGFRQVSIVHSLTVVPDRPWDLKVRTARFAVEACDFARRLPATPETNEVASQLRRAARSVAANYRAARRGRSDRDFIAKLAVVIEEADEALYWLEHLSESKMVAAEDAELLRCEATELVAIFTTAHKTARANLSRRKTLRRASTKRGA